MTRAEELSQVLRVEYLFHGQYCRWQQEGRLTGEAASRKINAERGAILKAKEACRKELGQDEYPEEYYYSDPGEFTPESPKKLIAVNKTRVPEGDGRQMDITDYMEGGKIAWRKLQGD